MSAATSFCVCSNCQSRVEVEPPNPTDQDEIEFVISGLFPTPCWQVDNFLVQTAFPGFIGMDMFTHEEGDACAQVITPFEVAYFWGLLDAGEYEVTVWEHRDPMYFWGLTEFTLEFTVTGSVATEQVSWGQIKACYR